MPVGIVQWRGEIGTFNNRKKIYFYKGPFCLLSALIYAFVWPLFQIFSMVHFTVNLICFAINSRIPAFDHGHEVGVSFSIYLKRLIEFNMKA